MPKEEKVIVPPTRKAVSEFRTPSPAVVFYTELVNRTDPAYVNNAPVKRGTQYSSMVGASQDVTTTYPNLYFLGERKLGQSDQLVLWDWASVPNAEDTYNAEVNYVSNGVPYPAFTRVYNVLRDVYEFIPALGIGSNLTALLGVIITERGNGYTYATGTIDGTNVEVDFVVSNGEVISGVVVNEGTGITSTSVIMINGDGEGATCIPIVQGTNCYLTSQKKQELPEGDPLKNEFVRVIRTYETLPGPFIETTRLDDDGVVVHVNTRRNIAADIVSSEALPGNVWTQTTKKGDDNFVAEENVETRTVRINSTVGRFLTSEKLEEDGMTTTITRERSSQAYIDTIATRETNGGGFWVKISSEQITDLVAWLITESRPIPGNNIVKTTIDADGDIVTETRNIVVGPPALVTTITTAGGVYTKTFGEPISDLVSWKVVQVKATQNSMDSFSAEIPDLLPEEFRPKVPITTTEETLIGNASAPTLPMPIGRLFEKQEQLSFNIYRLTIRGREGISLPQTITNKEITSQFGGGDVNRVLTLDLYNNLSLDEGLMVLTSEIRKIDDQANGQAVRTSRIVVGNSWPILDGTHIDEKYLIEIDTKKQTVDAGTTGGVLVDGTIVEVKPHDKWKSVQISSKLNPDTLPEDTIWFTGKLHSFPPELITGWPSNPLGVVIQWAEATCGCVDKFTAVLQANFNQYTGEVKTRVTEQFYNGVPPDDVTITQFFPQAHTFGFAFASVCGCGSDSTSRVTAVAPQFRLPLCLHDDLTLTIDGAFSWTFPATNPAALPHATYIMLPPHVERWRFGVFRRVLTEVLVP